MVRASSTYSCANDRQQTEPHEAIFLGILRSTQECISRVSMETGFSAHLQRLSFSCARHLGRERWTGEKKHLGSFHPPHPFRRPGLLPLHIELCGTIFTLFPRPKSSLSQSPLPFFVRSEFASL